MTHEESIISAIKKSLPAVVSIVIGEDATDVQKAVSEAVWREVEAAAHKEDTPENRSEIINHMPKTESGKVRVGFGSGFIVSPDGLILTNKHVVIDADAEYTVVTASEDAYKAQVLARDPLNDVAILKIKAEDLPSIDLGDSNNIRLGQTVITLGNALGEFQNSASAGIVSGLSRSITAQSDEIRAEHLRGLIQTDAAINPGNSGGPLVNLEGEVIAINSAIVYGAQNIGFAIPINAAKKDLADVMATGKIRRPFLGIRYAPLNPYIKEKMNLDSDQGVIVIGDQAPGRHGVLKGSPASKAGIKERDIILSANGTPLSAAYSLEEALSAASIGDTLSLGILRHGKTLTIPVELEERK